MENPKLLDILAGFMLLKSSLPPFGKGGIFSGIKSPESKTPYHFHHILPHGGTAARLLPQSPDLLPYTL